MRPQYRQREADTPAPPTPEHGGQSGRSDLPLISLKRVVLLAMLFGIVVFAVGAIMDWFLIRQGATELRIVEFSDVLAGVMAGLLAYRVLLQERERRIQLQTRIATIADMNHHIRNALQMISLSAHSAADQERLAIVKQGVDRIQWALREILPKI